MIKTPLKLLSLFLLLIISFIYTSKVTESALESDPVMKSIEKYKIKNDIEPIEPIIKENEMILGYSGLIIDKKASYKNMKEFNVFDENKIVYKNKLPKTTISKTYDYYIKKGNPKNKNVAIIFKVDDSKNVNELLKILSKNNITINFFVDGLWLEKNIESAFNIVNSGSLIYNLGYDRVYHKDSINITNNLIESITLEDSLYCLNEDKNNEEKKLCSKKKMHTITPTLIEPALTDLKKNLDEGVIISYDLKSFDMNKFILIVNTIKSKGYSITSLNKLLTE